MTVSPTDAARVAGHSTVKRRPCVSMVSVRRGYHAAAVPLRRYDGAAIGALCVAVWVEDSATESSAERHIPALTQEAEALSLQLL